ncbi:hypothetical protein J6590_104751 [Homalodisca vitripennis]|nr:hypothetical protein J6590_104751 [Homalodisca vitripennis]
MAEMQPTALSESWLGHPPITDLTPRRDRAAVTPGQELKELTCQVCLERRRLMNGVESWLRHPHITDLTTRRDRAAVTPGQELKELTCQVCLERRMLMNGVGRRPTPRFKLSLQNLGSVILPSQT